MFAIKMPNHEATNKMVALGGFRNCGNIRCIDRVHCMYLAIGKVGYLLSGVLQRCQGTVEK